jgi:phosphate starvation-inducible PhoH-like protein
MTKQRRTTRRTKSEYQQQPVEYTQDVKVMRTPKPFHVQPKNLKQQWLLDSIRDFPITVTIGCAGTGKTYCSSSMVASMVLTGKYDKIILTRANVATGKSLGHFPGTVQEKMAPWLLPITSVLEGCFGKGFYGYLVSKETIEIQPLETIRGRSYENSLVIVDEAQNLTMDEIKAITTRLGENSKMVLCGDPDQNDLGKESALKRFAEICKKHDIDIPIIEFGVDDIVRSDIVARIVRMLMKEKL